MFLTVLVSLLLVIFITTGFIEINYHDIGYKNPNYDKEKMMKWYQEEEYSIHSRRPDYCKETLYKKRLKFSLKNYYELSLGSACIVSILTIMLTLLLIIIAAVQIPRDIDFEKTKLEREMIIIKLDRIYDESNDDNIISGDLGSLEDAYRDALEYNKSIISHRYWKENIWLGWFWNPYIGELETIDLSRYK